MTLEKTLALAALLAAVASSSSATPTETQWSAQVALEAKAALGGCAVGDLVPSRPGQEIVCVSKDGSIYVAWRDGQTWKSTRVWQGQGELIQVAAGDLDPESPGDEIVAVGMAKGPERDDGPGALVVVSRRADAWRGEVVLESPKLIHGVCVHKGAAYAAGFDLHVHKVERSKDKRFRSTALVKLPGAGKCAYSTPGGVLIACTDGSLVRVEMHGTRPSLAILDRRKSGRARIGGSKGGIVVADNDGTLALITQQQTEDVARWTRTTLYSADAKLRGAVLADLEPRYAGLEAATVGYDARVVLLRSLDGEWWSRLLYRAGDRLHHLAVGNVDGSPGLDLVTCGYDKKLVVLSRADRKRNR